MADGPDEASQLPGDGRANLDPNFAPGLEQPVARTQTFLGDPGDFSHLLCRMLSPTLQDGGFPRRVPVSPGCLHQDPADMAIPGFGDTASGLALATGMLAWDHAQVFHELGCGGEAPQVADLGHQGGRGEPVDAAQRHVPLDLLGKRGFGAGLFDLALERFNLQPDEVLFIDDRPENTAAAAAVGIPAVVFSSPAALRGELVGRGLLAPGVPPGQSADGALQDLA